MPEFSVQRLLEELLKQEKRGKSICYQMVHWQGRKYKAQVLRLNPKGHKDDFDIRITQIEEN